MYSKELSFASAFSKLSP